MGTRLGYFVIRRRSSTHRGGPWFKPATSSREKKDACQHKRHDESPLVAQRCRRTASHTSPVTRPLVTGYWSLFGHDHIGGLHARDRRFLSYRQKNGSRKRRGEFQAIGHRTVEAHGSVEMILCFRAEAVLMAQHIELKMGGNEMDRLAHAVRVAHSYAHRGSQGGRACHIRSPF